MSIAVWPSVIRAALFLCCHPEYTSVGFVCALEVLTRAGTA